MIKIALCDDNLKSILNISKLMEAAIIEQELDAEVSIVTDNQNVIHDEMKKRKHRYIIFRHRLSKRRKKWR